jgi:V-type H+-transporting ATPase subunit a
MFGDVGHMLLGVGVMLYLKPNKWWWTLIFWMGYCGLIYDEFFGLNLGLFDSCYSIKHDRIKLKDQDCVCAFGLDPVWKVAENRMAFTNSYKMKLAVIIGVVHMTVGIFLRGVNSWRKRSYVDIFTIVIPQFLFMCVTFVYMDFLIVFKWLKNFSSDTSKAPSIINTMIAMVVGHKESGNLTLY